MSTAALPAVQNTHAAASSKWLIAIAVAMGALLEIIDTSIVNVALTDMQAALGATMTQVSWVISSYGIANVIILPLSAWLGHRFGQKNYFLFSMVGFTAASILCGMSTNLLMLVIARILQGLTGGGLMAKAQTILFQTFPKEEMATAQGIFGAVVIAGPSIGPTLGGWITTNIGWRWIFFINLPLGILATLMVMAYLPKDAERHAAGSVDWTAIGLLAVGLGSLQAFLEEGNSEDWFDSNLIIALSVAAVVGLVAFVLRSLRSKEPVVDIKVLRYRSLWSGSLLGMVVSMALYGALFSIPIFAQSILGFTSQQTGLLMLPGALATAAGMIMARKLAVTMDARVLLCLGAVIMVSALMMLTSLNPLTSEGDLFWPLIIRGVGTVCMFLPLQLATLGAIPRVDIAAATGLFNLFRQLGGSIGVALLSTLLDKRLAFHAAMLSESLVSNATATIERVNQLTGAMMAKGFPQVQAHQMALGMLQGSVQKQAMVIAFGDTFWATAALIIAFLPLVMLLGKPSSGAPAPDSH